MEGGKSVDIVNGCSYPANKLSNFEHYEFHVDGILCNSMEGFLQSLKFQDIEKQKEVCLLIGKEAKFKGKRKKWWREQILFWQGKEMKRNSDEYQLLLDKAFSSLSSNPKFQKVLLDTGDSVIKHSEGKQEEERTVLTEKEFCSRLMKVREGLKQKK